MYIKEWAIWLAKINVGKEVNLNLIPDLILDLNQKYKGTANLEDYSKEWDIMSSCIKIRMTWQLNKKVRRVWNSGQKPKVIKIVEFQQIICQ